MKHRVASAALLSVLVAGLWCVTTGRTSLEAWRMPVDYSDDALFTLGTLRAAQGGHLSPLGPIEVPELGAPHVAAWNGFLRQHKPQYWLAGRLARAIGLFPAANLLVLLATVLAALSFLAVSRYFQARAEWAVAGACAFALSPFFFYRSLSHLTLSNYWPIPLTILVVTWAFGRNGLPPGSRRFWVAAAITLVAGLHNLYYAALFGQFLGLACVSQWLVRRQLRAALGTLALLAVLIAAVLADNANLLLQLNSEKATALVVRPYGNLERYALKPLELLLPISEGGVVPWRAAGATYLRQALVRGELGSVYLGLAGVAALLALVLKTAHAALRRPARPLPATALALVWILAHSVVGGLNGLLGLTGFVWLRASGRYSIWILALVLLWGVLAISRTALGRHRLPSLFAATIALALTLADQLPPRAQASAIRDMGMRVASDAAFARSLETALPAGAMLFQLPVVDFPEGRRILAASDYEHLRPYFYASQLRFSYGADKGRPHDAWQRRVEALEPAAMADALERIGFAGIVVNRKAYPNGAQELRDALAAAGRFEAWESPDHDFLFVRLTPGPATHPPDVVVPHADESGGS